jgi:enoyl-CoA hydratase/carnithine racemase
VEGRVSSPARGVESGHISVAEQQAVAVVTLRRPEKLNALSVGMRRELAAILCHFGRGDTARPVPQPARSGR